MKESARNFPTITKEPFDRYAALWEMTKDQLLWNCPFVLPFWLDSVRIHLGSDDEPVLLVVRDNSRIIGIAPMVLKRRSAGFMGLHHVCDYQDIITAPGHEVAVMEAVLVYLKGIGIQSVHLRTLRPDSRVLLALNALAGDDRWNVQTSDDDVTYEMALPPDWNQYLMQLSGKQRHEVRRKIRRLETHGPFSYRAATGDSSLLKQDIDLFFGLFRSNRQDKVEFLTSSMEGYFSTLIRNLAQAGLLRLFFLEVRGHPTAGVLSFDYGGVRYLYNCGFDQEYDYLSVGVLSKIFSIQDGIESGCKRFDFLKGPEVYKSRIGGSMIPLHQCRIEFFSNNNE